VPFDTNFSLSFQRMTWTTWWPEAMRRGRYVGHGPPPGLTKAVRVGEGPRHGLQHLVGGGLHPMMEPCSMPVLRQWVQGVEISRSLPTERYLVLRLQCSQNILGELGLTGLKGLPVPTKFLPELPTSIGEHPGQVFPGGANISPMVQGPHGCHGDGAPMK
jgi:hypothetical protein